MKKVIISVVLFALIFLYACSPKIDQTITITFETNGGSLIEDIIIDSSLNFVLPDDPIKEGYTFAGWYLDNDTFEVEYAITLLEQNITLYAKWIEDETEEELMNVIPFEEGFLGGCFVELRDGSLKAIIRDHQELIDAFEEHEIVWSDNTPIWERYNNDFFETKAIILYCKVTSSMTPTYVLKNVQMEDDALTLHIVGQYYGDTMCDAIGFASFVIEVNKSDINNITDYEIKVEYERLGD